MMTTCVRTDASDTCFTVAEGSCRTSTHELTATGLPAGSYRLNDKSSLGACQAACAETDGCVAVEWARTRDDHCEIWTVLPTHADPNCDACSQAEFGCYTATLVPPLLTPVGATGTGQCVPEGEPRNYNGLPEGSVRLNDQPSLDACVARCLAYEGCVAVEFASQATTCELWTTEPAGAGDDTTQRCVLVDRHPLPAANVTYDTTRGGRCGGGKGKGKGGGDDDGEGDGDGEEEEDDNGGEEGDDEGGKGKGRGKGSGDGDCGGGKGKGGGDRDGDGDGGRDGDRDGGEGSGGNGRGRGDGDGRRGRGQSGLSTAEVVAIVAGGVVGASCLLCIGICIGAYHARRVKARIAAATEAAKRAAPAARAEPTMHNISGLALPVMGHTSSELPAYGVTVARGAYEVGGEATPCSPSSASTSATPK